jgi:glycogen debranching enzyme
MVEDAAIEPRHDRRTGVVHPQMPMSLEEWTDRAPRLTCESSALCATYEQSLLDLASLRFRPTRDLDHSLPAAGQPWFMALFGRDSIIAAFEALPFHSSLAAATLRVLAARQSQVDDPVRDAEPGKILHEVRSIDAQRGAGADLDVPAYPYFGSHDATPLFLILLDEYHRWTGDDQLVVELEDAARAALTWIERSGDLDGDGYLEYRRRAPHGLENQCWKDSWNSMRFADGRFARPPIATCEIQGYAFDARRRTARLARECWDDPSLAQHLELDANELYDRFNRDFFDDSRGRYVLALDGDKQQVDALTSNIGHLLWSGIVPAERSELVADQVVGEQLFTGWGVRTMGDTETAYNPIEYHNGCVWPHDTALVAEGLRRVGALEEAALLAGALLDAAREFAGQLPEVFAGFDRRHTRVPVEYPSASRPQAFAAGAPLLVLRTILGLDPADDARPGCGAPPGTGAIRLEHVHVQDQDLTFSS